MVAVWWKIVEWDECVVLFSESCECVDSWKVWVSNNLLYLEWYESFDCLCGVRKAFCIIFPYGDISPCTVKVVIVFAGYMSECCYVVVLSWWCFVVEWGNICSWCDDGCDFSLDQLAWDGSWNLFCNSYLVSFVDEFVDVFINAMIGDACHGDRVRMVFVFGREGEVEQFACEFGIFPKHFIKISQTKK